MVEKPAPDEAPSTLALPGRYVFPGSLFGYLERTKPGKGGEIQLTDAAADLMRNEGLLGYRIEGLRYDAGDRLGFLKANVVFGLQNVHVGADFRAFLEEIIGR
jgi:UTP--glucose-1-phosphate uridylyltransferase